MISNPVHDEVYSIKIVSDLRQVRGFLHQQNWPPWYNWNIAERDIQHHKTKPSIYRWPNTENLNKMSSKWPPCSHIDFSRKYIVCISPSINTTSLQIISSWSQTSISYRWIIPKHQYGCCSTILNCSCISTLFMSHFTTKYKLSISTNLQ